MVQLSHPYIHDYWKNHSFDLTDLCWQSNVSLFNKLPRFVMGVPDSLVGKESACNAGDPGLIPGSGRSAGEGIGYSLKYSWVSFVAQLVKNPSSNVGELGSIPGLGRFPGEGKGYPLQYSGLEHSMDYIVHRVAKSWT